MSEKAAGKDAKQSDAKCEAGGCAEVSTKPKMCFIVGCSNSREEVPWELVQSGQAEAWGVNNLFHSMPMGKYPWTRWFEIHQIERDEAGRHRRRGKKEFRGELVDNYLENLGKLGIPVYMQKLWPQVPNSVTYPLEQMLHSFGDYFTNSISYQIALAISMGFEEIRVYGVDMAVSSKQLLHDEYSHQRPSVEYFLGIAIGRGIKIMVPNSADLLKTRFLYGFDEPKATKWDEKRESMLAHIRHQKMTASHAKMEAQRKEDQAIGAELAIIEMDKVWQ